MALRLRDLRRLGRPGPGARPDAGRARLGVETRRPRARFQLPLRPALAGDHPGAARRHLRRLRRSPPEVAAAQVARGDHLLAPGRSHRRPGHAGGGGRGGRGQERARGRRGRQPGVHRTRRRPWSRRHHHLGHARRLPSRWPRPPPAPAGRHPAPGAGPPGPRLQRALDAADRDRNAIARSGSRRPDAHRDSRPRARRHEARRRRPRGGWYLPRGGPGGCLPWAVGHRKTRGPPPGGAWPDPVC